MKTILFEVNKNIKQTAKNLPADLSNFKEIDQSKSFVSGEFFCMQNLYFLVIFFKLISKIYTLQ